PEMLAIADGADNAIGLAGIMGGATTEISEATRCVALEVANWNPANIRRTSRQLGLRSEASSRFEKGLPPYLTALALDRAAALMAELAGGTILHGMIDVGHAHDRRRVVSLPVAEPRRLLGMEVSRDQIVESLLPLGFELAAPDAQPGDDTLAFSVPLWREDVTEEADLVEEIARMIGYDRVPETLLRGGVAAVEADAGQEWTRRLRPFLLGCGLSEANSHTLVGDALLEQFRAP